MSLGYIKRLVYNKYDELYNGDDTIQDDIISKEIENFIYELLDKYDKNKVMYFIKELFDIEFKYIDENQLKLQVCRNDDEFRKAVKDKYKTCIICDVNDCHKSAYEVAHIFDFSKCDNVDEKYDINNGLLMCGNMHKYFDDFLLKFNVDNVSGDNYLVKIVFCDTMNEYSFYKKYNGKKILFNKDNILYLERKNNIKCLL